MVRVGWRWWCLAGRDYFVGLAILYFRRVAHLMGLVIGCASLLVSSSLAAADVSSSKIDQDARLIAQRFAGTLKPVLKQALASGGPVAAIEVCSKLAPAIASDLSQETGWSVRRVSLRPRNESLAAPDAWEREQLQLFDARQLAGEPVIGISHGEEVAGTYRYIQALPVESLCLQCHGESIAPDVSAALKQYYPRDLATGYQIDQVRGAISLTRPARLHSGVDGNWI